MADPIRLVPPPTPVRDLSDGDADRLWRHIALRIFELHAVFASRPVTDEGRCDVCLILAACDGLDDAIARVDVAFRCAYLAAYCVNRQALGASAEDLSKSWCSIISSWVHELDSEEAVLARAARLDLPGGKQALAALRARAGAA